MSGLCCHEKAIVWFRGILCRGKVTNLHCWLEDARKRGIHSLERFVRIVRQDIAAVESAVTERWSSGPVEGQVNRLKALKRLMYGQVGVALLRARVLPLPLLEIKGPHTTKVRKNPLTGDYAQAHAVSYSNGIFSSLKYMKLSANYENSLKTGHVHKPGAI